MALDPRIHAITKRIGLDPDYIAEKAAEVAALAAADHLELSGNILVGFDLNGPLARTDDAALTPYEGTGEILRFLQEESESCPGGRLQPVIVTGWDLLTSAAFARMMGEPEIAIICERGMVYRLDHTLRFLYPHNDAESHLFMAECWRLAADIGLKVAFQGNQSSGSQAIMVEADHRAGLWRHPLLMDRNIRIEDLFTAVHETSQVTLDGGRLLFDPNPDNMAGLHRALTGAFALTSLRASRTENGRIAVTVDDQDRSEYTLDDLARFSVDVAKNCDRVAFINPDYGVDFLTNEALSGRYSKEAAAASLGREVFSGEPFLTVSVGDNEQEIFFGHNVIHFAQQGSPMCDLLMQRGQAFVTVRDGRDCALALYEAHRAAQLRMGGAQ